ncbi:MAG: VOC family protein [Candidatus Andersenbacteria bacterium]|nr:VOC family protein [Candidatus Andersenbacteria bacterium]
MNPVVHFEMPAEDIARMRTFYETAFGWQTNQLGEEMGDYVTVTTAEKDPNDPMGLPKNPGAINGGFYKKNDDPLSFHPSIVVSVDDIRDAMKKVAAAGGQVIGGHLKNGEPDEILGVGLFASIIDTEGNRVSLLQPKGM